MENLILSDRITSSEQITVEIPANGFIIISKDIEYLINEYGLEPELCYEAKLPTYNNTDDIVKISNNGNILDSLEYDSDWGEKGKSLERINYYGSSTDEENWGASESNASPLQINSIAKIIDLTITSSTLEVDGFKVVVENKGNINSGGFILEMLVNDIKLGEYEMEEIRSSSDEESVLDYRLYGYDPKYTDKIEIRIVSENDINPTNNSFILYIPRLTQKGAVLINEIMYDTDENHYEFVELFNNSDIEIQMSNWFIADELDLKNNRFNLITSNANLLPNEYAIIVSDSSSLSNFEDNQKKKILFTKKKISLNNSGDKICIYNENKQLIDSMEYSDKWQESYLNSTKNISLEKVSPELESNNSTNWKTCTSESGSTPLDLNSYFQKLSLKENINCSPNPFSPSSSNEPYVVVSYELPFENALIDFSIFYPSGEKVYDVIQSRYSGKTGILTWNGRNNNDSILPLGPYIAIVKATDQNSGDSQILKTVIVIAK